MARFLRISTGNHKINARIHAKTSRAAIATARFRTNTAIRTRSIGSVNLAPPAAEYSGTTVSRAKTIARVKITFSPTREKRRMPGRDFKISLSSAYTIHSDSTQEIAWSGI